MEDKNNKARPLRHVALIMDGNGRWAKQRGLSRSQGHSEGAKTAEKLIEHAVKLGLENLTLYAFSTENWIRPKDEVDALMKLFSVYLDRFIKKFTNGKDPLYDHSRLNIAGDLTFFDKSLQVKMQKAIEIGLEREIVKTTVNIAVNYGGRQEIVNAVNRFISQHHDKRITEKDITDNTYFKGQPDPDLVIRTAGEMRLSNFLIWECAYSEYYCAEEFFPDFTPQLFDKALEAYKHRSRRFGGL